MAEGCTYAQVIHSLRDQSPASYRPLQGLDIQRSSLLASSCDIFLVCAPFQPTPGACLLSPCSVFAYLSVAHDKCPEKCPSCLPPLGSIDSLPPTLHDPDLAGFPSPTEDGKPAGRDRLGHPMPLPPNPWLLGHRPAIPMATPHTKHSSRHSLGRREGRGIWEVPPQEI